METAECRHFLLWPTSNHLKSTSNVEEPMKESPALAAGLQRSLGSMHHALPRTGHAAGSLFVIVHRIVEIHGPVSPSGMRHRYSPSTLLTRVKTSSQLSIAILPTRWTFETFLLAEVTYSGASISAYPVGNNDLVLFLVIFPIEF